jgi:hypothetical protein
MWATQAMGIDIVKAGYTQVGTGGGGGGALGNNRPWNF